MTSRALSAAALALTLSLLPAVDGTHAQSPAIHHNLSTNAAAQAAFDRGLLDYYAYNPEAAEHDFYAAADFDHHLAMAYWGIAISNAPNLNVMPTDDRDSKARRAIRRAVALEKYAATEDRALIEAASARLDGAPALKLDALKANYAQALHTIASTYPDDPDVAALAAEASLYSAIGDLAYSGIDEQTPAERDAFTAQMGALLPFLQTSLAKFPKHIGLLHFYIHTAEYAQKSSVAVDAAKQLAAFALAPEYSHLTHMPGHTFFDVGLYPEALDVSTRSVAMDYADFDCCHPGFYGASRFYHGHNVMFLLYAMAQTAHAADAVAVAQREENPYFLAQTLAAAHRWDDVIAMPYAKGASPTITFARGLAFAELGKIDEANAMLAAIPEPPTGQPSRAEILRAMKLTLSAQIAIAQHDDAQALQRLTQASGAAIRGDELAQAETPSLYFFSPHMALADLAMRLGKTDVAKAALQSELVASPREAAATNELAKLNGAR